jgi:hypothetical protein
MNGYEIFEQWMGGHNDALAPFAPMFMLGKVTAGTIESVARRNYDLAGDCFDLGLSQMKVFAGGHDVAQFGAEESRLAKESPSSRHMPTRIAHRRDGEGP